MNSKNKFVFTLNNFKIRGDFMPSNFLCFYDSLNFFYNYGKYVAFIKKCQELYKTLTSNLTNAKKAISLNYNFEESKKTKCLNKIDDISYTLKTLIEKVNKSDDTVQYVYQEAQKLAKDVDQNGITGTVCKKSEILRNKLNHTIVSITMIKDIFTGAKDRIDLINSKLQTPSPNLLEILKLTKDILQLTTDYNIAKLKRAQEKFEESKELKDFMYGKKHPKLAQLFSLTSSVPMDAGSTSCELRTPFGLVWVKLSESDQSRMIYTDKACNAENAPKYDRMCENLDWYFNPSINNICSRQDAIDGIISPIIKYISQPLKEASSFASVKCDYPILSNMLPYYKRSAAFLCGVLLLSESHEFRNPTGGKFERKAMNNVKRLAENGCKNPFSVVFGNKKGRFIPAKDKSEFRKLIKGDESISEDNAIGGQRQASVLINLHSIDVRYFLPNAKFDVAKLAGVAKTYETDYTKKVEEIIKSLGIGDESWDRRSEMLLKGELSSRFKRSGDGDKLTHFPDFPTLEKLYEGFCKGFRFIQNLKGANERTTFDIEDLPDIPEKSILARLKKITKVKNLKRFNKLMNGL